MSVSAGRIEPSALVGGRDRPPDFPSIDVPDAAPNPGANASSRSPAAARWNCGDWFWSRDCYYASLKVPLQRIYLRDNARCRLYSSPVHWRDASQDHVVPLWVYGETT